MYGCVKEQGEACGCDCLPAWILIEGLGTGDNRRAQGSLRTLVLRIARLVFL